MGMTVSRTNAAICFWVSAARAPRSRSTCAGLRCRGGSGARAPEECLLDERGDVHALLVVDGAGVPAAATGGAARLQVEQHPVAETDRAVEPQGVVERGGALDLLARGER